MKARLLARRNAGILSFPESRTLTMRSSRGQENRLAWREFAELAARAEDVTALALSNKDIKIGVPQHFLKVQHHGIIGTAECTARKFIEWNEIHFASYPVQQLYQSFGILLSIIYASQQDVFEGQPPVRCQRILSACG